MKYITINTLLEQVTDTDLIIINNKPMYKNNLSEYRKDTLLHVEQMVITNYEQVYNNSTFTITKYYCTTLDWI